MNQQNCDRLQDYFRTQDISAALLSSPWTITWLTGYAAPVQTGPNPFEGGPALAWWQDGELTLILSDTEAPAAQACGVSVSDYLSYTIDRPIAGLDHQAAVLSRVLSAAAPRAGKIAIDMAALPAALLAAVQVALAGRTVEPLAGDLEMLRAVKSPEEVARIRAALGLCDLAQAEVAAGLRPGVTEIELWGQMKARLEREAGTRLPVLADLAGGKRTGDIGGLPGTYAMQEGDPIIVDVVPRLNGYWGDNCGTHFAGQPSPEMARIYSVVRETLQRGLDAVRPGLRACELDAMLRGSIRDAGYEPYPHHSGHGIGVSYHEEPRIVPYQELALAPGMIVALEPGIYLSGIGGVRLEDVVLVTDDGCELLTRHLVS